MSTACVQGEVSSRCGHAPPWRSAVAAAVWMLAACAGGGGGDTAGTPTTPPAPARVATVELSPGGASLVAGRTVQLTAIAKDATGATLSGRTATWNSGNPAVATVNASGVVSAVAPGTAAVSATVDGIAGSATITVTPVPVASVVVDPLTLSLQVGATRQLSATARDSAGGALGGRTVTWASASPAVATVSAQGAVTAVTSGTTTVIATVDGIAGSATITVTPVPVASVQVTPATLSLTLGQQHQFSATLRDSAGGFVGGRAVTWSVASPAVATVSAQGMVTALSSGSTSVIATVEGRSGSATVTVPVAAPYMWTGTWTTGWTRLGSPPPCPADLSTLFTRLPFDINQVTAIRRPGFLSTSSGYKAHAHVRWAPTDAAGQQVIVAPADGWLYGAARYVEAYTPGNDQIILNFFTECGVMWLFDHLRDGRLAPAIAAAIASVPLREDSQGMFLPVPVRVRAGDLLATAVGVTSCVGSMCVPGGGPNIFLDFGVYDPRQLNLAARTIPGFLSGPLNSWQGIGICWLDLFPGSRPALNAKAEGESHYC